jgi:HEAT repeat protein
MRPKRPKKDVVLKSANRECLNAAHERLKKRVTIEAWAEGYGFSKTNYHDILNGKPATLEMLKKVCDAVAETLQNDGLKLRPGQCRRVKEVIADRESEYRDWLKGRYKSFPVPRLAGGENSPYNDINTAAQAQSLDVEEERKRQQEQRESSSPTLYALDREALVKLLDANPHLAFTGNAGQGKTTTLHRCCLHFADTDRLPVFIKAREWEASKLSLPEYIEQADFLKECGFAEMGASLRQAITEGHAAILIDGLDEADNPAEVVEKIRSLRTGRYGHNTLLATSRKTVVTDGIGRVMELQPLTRMEIETYLRNRLGPTKHLDVWNGLKDSPQMLALAGDGIFIAMLCWLKEEEKPDAPFALPATEDSLYSQITTRFLSEPFSDTGLRRSKRGEGFYAPDEVELKHRLLAEIAFHIYFCRTDQAAETSLANDCARRIIAASELTEEHKRACRNGLLRNIVQDSGLLTTEPPDNPQRYFFTHPTFLEYYTARYLREKWQEEHDPAARKPDELSLLAWLPAFDCWQWEKHVIPGEDDPDKWPDCVNAFSCPQRHGTLPSFARMVVTPRYHRMLLLLVGMMDLLMADSFLKFTNERLPLAYGYPKRLEPQYYQFWFDTDEYENICLQWNGSNAGSRVEYRFAIHHIKIALEFALQAISRRPVSEDRSEQAQRVLTVLCPLNHIEDEAFCRVFGGPPHPAFGGPITIDETFTEAVITLSRAQNSATARVGIDFFLNLMQSEEFEFYRWYGSWVLGRIGTLTEKLMAVEVFKSLAMVEGGCCLHAIEALGQIDEPKAVTALTALANEAEDEYIRCSAAKTLGQTNGEEEKQVAVKILCELMKTAKHEFDRFLAAQALGEIGGPNAVEMVTAFANEAEDTEIRRTAIELLGEIGGSEVVKTLTALANTVEDELVRSAAATTLGQIGGEEEKQIAVQILGELMKKTKSAWVRSDAARELEKIGGTKERTAAIEALKKVAETNSGIFSYSATRALGQIGGQEAVNALTALMNTTEYEEVLYEACRALGEIGVMEERESAIEELTELAQTAEGEWLRRDAARALGRMRGTEAEVALLEMVENDENSLSDLERETIAFILLNRYRHLAS